MTIYDSPWKGMIEHYFREFIAFFFPDAHTEIDWARGYSFMDKGLRQVTRDAGLGRRMADKLVRVHHLNGSPAGLFDRNDSSVGRSIQGRGPLSLIPDKAFASMGERRLLQT